MGKVKEAVIRTQEIKQHYYYNYMDALYKIKQNRNSKNLYNQNNGVNMQTKQNTQSNASTVSSSSFQSILQKMKKITSADNLRVANKHWSIYDAGVSVNQMKYNTME